MPGPKKVAEEKEIREEDEQIIMGVRITPDIIEAVQRQRIIIQREGQTPLQNAVWWSELTDEQQRSEIQRWKNQHGFTAYDTMTVILIWGFHLGYARSRRISGGN